MLFRPFGALSWFGRSFAAAVPRQPAAAKSIAADFSPPTTGHDFASPEGAS